ncbi:ribonuclease TTHA0252 [Arthrobacter sp. Hiyo8]|nr:ribonuclease TTHA0252 [Arthrobacter sp. Hiyo8]
MKKWTRWQDWTVIAAGAYAALSVLWTSQGGSSTALMVILGVLLVAAGVTNLAMPGMPAAEWAQAVFAVVLLLAPWFGGFTSMTGAAWSAWIPGAVALVVTAFAIKPSTEEYRHHHVMPARSRAIPERASGHRRMPGTANFEETSMNSNHPARLRFFGATDTVTGSRYLLESRDTRILVDCGLFQGYKRIRDRNRIPFPVAPGSIDAVLLTHAHLDHTGYVPALVRDGFTGPVYATHGTSELCKLLLPDSGHLQEEEARYADHRVPRCMFPRFRSTPRPMRSGP